jgi:hypothetical protein
MRLTANGLNLESTLTLERQAVPPELLEFRLSMLLSKSRFRHKREDDAP